MTALTPDPWELVRFNFWIDPVFDQRIQASGHIRLQVAQAQGDAARTWQLLSRAHVYQISPAKDELDSGLGRENGIDAVQSFLQTKSVWINSGATAGNPFVLR